MPELGNHLTCVDIDAQSYFFPLPNSKAHIVKDAGTQMVRVTVNGASE